MIKEVTHERLLSIRFYLHLGGAKFKTVASESIPGGIWGHQWEGGLKKRPGETFVDG